MFPPAAVFGLGAALSCWSAFALQDAILARHQLRYEGAVQVVVDRIDARVEAYIALLHGAAGLFAAVDDDVSSDAFGRYVERILAFERYAGVQGICWAPLRDETVSVLYIHPPNERNSAAIGFDMMTDPVRREAMLRARDDGVASMSGKLLLKQEVTDVKQPGFILYVPVYEGGDVPATVDERRARLRGFVSAAFRAEDLLAAIFDVGRAANPGAEFAIYDGDAIEPAALLVDRRHAPPGFFDGVARMDVAHRPWTLSVRGLPSLARSEDAWLPGTLGAVGLGVSLVLALLAYTQLRAQRERERLLDELAASLAARDEFISAASHELKTPLAAIGLTIGTFERAVKAGKADALRADQVGKLARLYARMERLVDQLLDVSRATAGPMKLHRAELDLVALVREVIARYPPEASIDVVGPTPVVGTWDQDRLDQVVTNLVGNALKYGAGAPVHVTVDRAADRAVLRVRDGGPGVDVASRERIFDRFERVPATSHHGGLGLGLWITRQIVDAHGGRVFVEPGAEPGANFVVELPIP